MSNVGCFLTEDFRGSYSARFSGVILSSGTKLQVEAVGVLFADGKGGLRVERMLMQEPSGPLPQSGSGTYELKSNGMGSASLSIPGVPAEEYSFVIDSGGDQVHFIMTSIHVNVKGFFPYISGTAKRQ